MSGFTYRRWAKESVALSRRNSAGWIPESMDKWSVGVGRKHAQSVVQDTVNEASVSAATPDWCAVLSC